MSKIYSKTPNSIWYNLCFNNLSYLINKYILLFTIIIILNLFLPQRDSSTDTFKFINLLETNALIIKSKLNQPTKFYFPLLNKQQKLAIYSNNHYDDDENNHMNDDEDYSFENLNNNKIYNTKFDWNQKKNNKNNLTMRNFVKRKQFLSNMEKNLIIEKFKQRILTQLNLNSTPQVDINNESAWNSLPLLLRNRLKSEIDSSNRILPENNDEEKETLILLKENKYRLAKTPSIGFDVKIADQINSNQISNVTLHVELSDEIHEGAIITCWEFTPPWIRSRYYWYKNHYIGNDPNIDDIVIKDSFDEYNDVGFTSENDNLYMPSYSIDNTDMYRLIKPEIVSHIIITKQNSVAITFDITNRIKQWFTEHKTNELSEPLLRYLMITCKNCDDVHGNIVDPKKAIMEIRYRSGLQRQRRSTSNDEGSMLNECGSNGHHFICCTQTLTVEFSEIGWDNWIIHPKSFKPNYCRGSCQIASTKSLHYVAMDLLLRKNLSQFANIPREEVQSCCHPTHFTSMSVLYFDSNRELQMHTLHNLVVLGCGCS